MGWAVAAFCKQAITGHGLMVFPPRTKQTFSRKTDTEHRSPLPLHVDFLLQTLVSVTAFAKESWEKTTHNGARLVRGSCGHLGCSRVTCKMVRCCSHRKEALAPCLCLEWRVSLGCWKGLWLAGSVVPILQPSREVPWLQNGAEVSPAALMQLFPVCACAHWRQLMPWAGPRTLPMSLQRDVHWKRGGTCDDVMLPFKLSLQLACCSTEQLHLLFSTVGLLGLPL